MIRNETRMHRYNEKRKVAIIQPVTLVSVNFKVDGNLAFLIRAAACFGADVNVIGHLPDRSQLKDASGSTIDYVSIKKFTNPSDFLETVDFDNSEIVSAELCDDAVSMYDFNFNNKKHTYIVVGNETSGVPTEILLKSKKVYIPMPGLGYCLNTSQTANIMLCEFSRQMFVNAKNWS